MLQAEILNSLKQKMRAAFPALDGPTAFFENAGGSQIPGVVIEAISNYYRHHYAQLGAGYRESVEATEIVHRTHEWMELFINAKQGHVVLGPSTSVLLRILADSWSNQIRPGDEIIIADSNHEANISPWLRLQHYGAVIRWWTLDRSSWMCPLDQLSDLLNSKTRLIVLPHVSNLLGGVTDVERVTKLAHGAGARVVVDGVAFAPHRAIDVAKWNVDWYVFSNYKVYGPHAAVLFGKASAFKGLEGPNHFFVDSKNITYKFELGGVNHEACAGILALTDYFLALTGETTVDRSLITKAYDLMQAMEKPLIDRLVTYLASKQHVTLIGPACNENRVGTVSFIHENLKCSQIVSHVDQSRFAIRHGHMYAYRLCQRLGLDPEEGVVRISFVHYNTIEEVEDLIEILDRIL